MLASNASLAPSSLAMLNGGADLEHMRNAIRESAASVEALKQRLLGTAVGVEDVSVPENSSPLGDLGATQVHQAQPSQIPPQSILSIQEQLPQMSTMPAAASHQINVDMFPIGTSLNMSLGALSAQGSTQNMLLSYMVGFPPQQVLPLPPPPPLPTTSALAISISPNETMPFHVITALGQTSSAGQTGPATSSNIETLSSPPRSDSASAKKVEALENSDTKYSLYSGSERKDGLLTARLETSTEPCKFSQESPEVEAGKPNKLGVKPKKKRKGATRIIEEIWAMEHEQKDGISFTQLPLEEKRKQAKADLAKLQRQMKQLAKNQPFHKSGKMGKGSDEHAEQVGPSATATALLSSPCASNEALEKAKAALAAIERQTLQSRETNVSMPSGGAVSGEFITSEQQYIWMTQNGMASEQAEAIQSATAAAHQAQLMQQFQFHQQNRQHEQQQRLQGGGRGILPSRFQDGYMPLFLCKKLTALGHCPRGEACTFAHCVEELHPASPDFPKLEELSTVGVLSEQAQEVDQLPDVKMKRKRSMCLRYAKGECMLGKQCPFAHKEEDLGTVELVLCGNVKTRICKMWQAGKCIYAVNCWDAHGEKEIGLKRPPPELAPKIKRVKKEVNDV